MLLGSESLDGKPSLRTLFIRPSVLSSDMVMEERLTEKAKITYDLD